MRALSDKGCTPHQNQTETQAKVKPQKPSRTQHDLHAAQLVIGVFTPFRGIDLCRSVWRRQDLWRRLDLVMRTSSHNILTSDALQVLSSSQVTPGVVNVHGYGRYVKSTYIHTVDHRRMTPMQVSQAAGGNGVAIRWSRSNALRRMLQTVVQYWSESQSPVRIMSMPSIEPYAHSRSRTAPARCPEYGEPRRCSYAQPVALWWRRRHGHKAHWNTSWYLQVWSSSVWLPEWVMKDTPSPVQQLNTDQD
jgi:hypothetical protein